MAAAKKKKEPEAPEAQEPEIKVEGDGELEKLTREKEEYLLLAQRLQADFDNYRKRNNSVREDSYNEGIADTVKKFLPLMDDMDRAVAVEEAGGATGKLFDALVLMTKQFRDVLKSVGVEEICAVGEPFDPELHEAISGVEADEEHEPDTVFDELRKGYTYKGKVLRHSMVRVAK